MILESVNISVIIPPSNNVFVHQINNTVFHLRDAMAPPPKYPQLPLTRDVYIQQESHRKQDKKAKETLEETALENSHPAALRTRNCGEFFRCASVN